MKIQDVVNQTLTDPQFAQQIQAQAVQAARDGVGSAAWHTLAQHFASDPNELTRLSSLNKGMAAAGPGTTTTTITTITTTVACTCTTTTTTTTDF